MINENGSTGKNESAFPTGKRRALIELAVAYALILLVIWTPRPQQRFLWLLAAGTVAAMVCFSFDNLNALGVRRKNFFRSLWVVGVALATAAIAISVSSSLHTLGLATPGAEDASGWGEFSHSAKLVAQTYWGYALWTFLQQFLLQGFFLLRLLRLLPGPKSAGLVAAGMFALAHLPNPILTAVTLIWGFAACMLFQRYRNLHTLSMAHAIFGITLAITIPGPMIHNMRVGLGYLTYSHPHTAAVLSQPQRPNRVH